MFTTSGCVELCMSLLLATVRLWSEYITSTKIAKIVVLTVHYYYYNYYYYDDDYDYDFDFDHDYYYLCYCCY